MKEKFLPIGSVVMLKNGKKAVMITSYCVVPTGTQIEGNKETTPKQIMYDYGACAYPEGILDSSVSYAFNHDKIDKILYVGYETKEQKEFSDMLNGGLKILNEKKGNN